ncbi:MAG TPA: helix-turn-helix domain-containing protein [Candidatus Polarisedimenticolia bacterium]|nr:helix-turn-helix domain-containing protein [Candidatus Polarisedimenticolia bacterium]
MNAQLEPVLQAARTLPPAELPRLLGDLEEVRATALARLSAPASVQQTDEFLTVKAAAQRLGCSADYLYKNSASLPFTRHLGKKLLFSTRGIEEYLRQGKP